MGKCHAAKEPHESGTRDRGEHPPAQCAPPRAERPRQLAWRQGPSPGSQDCQRCYRPRHESHPRRHDKSSGVVHTRFLWPETPPFGGGGGSPGAIMSGTSRQASHTLTHAHYHTRTLAHTHTHTITHYHTHTLSHTITPVILHCVHRRAGYLPCPFGGRHPSGQSAHRVAPVRGCPPHAPHAYVPSGSGQSFRTRVHRPPGSAAACDGLRTQPGAERVSP